MNADWVCASIKSLLFIVSFVLMVLVSRFFISRTRLLGIYAERFMNETKSSIEVK